MTLTALWVYPATGKGRRHSGESTRDDEGGGSWGGTRTLVGKGLEGHPEELGPFFPRVNEVITEGIAYKIYVLKDPTCKEENKLFSKAIYNK